MARLYSYRYTRQVVREPQWEVYIVNEVRDWLDSLDPAELNRIVIPRPFPPQIATTFSARVAGPEGLTLLDTAECWIYQHGLRHMGEIELARGLVGLGGMTS